MYLRLEFWFRWVLAKLWLRRPALRILHASSAVRTWIQERSDITSREKKIIFARWKVKVTTKQTYWHHTKEVFEIRWMSQRYLSHKGCPACRHWAAVWLSFWAAWRATHPADRRGTHCRSRRRKPKERNACLPPGRPLQSVTGCRAPDKHCLSLQGVKDPFYRDSKNIIKIMTWPQLQNDRKTTSLFAENCFSLSECVGLSLHVSTDGLWPRPCMQEMCCTCVSLLST